MGAFESSESYELSPPPPSRSTLFVVRNGRYEPQNLMPILPRPDMLDFDGFVVRRGAGQGGMNACPPEMRQANLVKNPVSVRRDSVRALGGGQEPTASSREEDGKSPVDAAQDDGVGLVDKPLVLSFTFDALAPGTLTLHLLVTEVETPLEDPSAEESKADDGSGEVKPNDKKHKKKGPTSIELVPRERKTEEQEKHEDEKLEGSADLLGKDAEPAPAPAPEWAVDTRRIETGLGQVYQSPPLDFERWPAAQLAYDPSRPREVPIAIRLEADVEPGEPQSVQYSYITLQNVAPAPSPSADENKIEVRPQWSAQIYSQKLHYGLQCFVLREVFGVTSKIAHETDVEGGNSDCVICLSEPRDTAVLPCRHMCFCSYCAGIVRLQCDRCPVCRQKVQSLLQFKRDQDTENLVDPFAGPKCADTVADGLAVGAASASLPSNSASASAATTPAASGSAMAPMASAATN